MELNESPAFLLMDPTIVHTRRDLPISMYETGGRQHGTLALLSSIAQQGLLSWQCCGQLQGRPAGLQSMG
jgi:hypothetical protein